ncbi:MAG: bifunctional phosphoribosylaminoimidazolecarboxamide formyltransferase/IMP cyclohydrolase [Bacteroidetes bacterium RIFOXYA12_FULL_35_11]|nr:MAG: bifunctional phosphoribosylaminoimidazolecarboxamide formyltransferase/IMP cyclohydrolase [Bacteroidetes bacterium GWF2_35_48]OFY73534.1 MAG: bifunctional phosphoribosylaminoimidazolecarboxamide formyltransferase/IMP cyclohydrolase [Bacteroidetes bacterium RIFOXYA12_FULL_35_11]OFY96475.1 MAG: bifunctional phosphoribosylaminoimidazolecarboxamide formyltransferase/IMP cyclohydrolase [Bacteroidetes bacterium RIFOXYB2_FULL_35_7]OFY96705.1 MAG: bifunctional phosphoribosylaminoimidazolecarboxa
MSEIRKIKSALISVYHKENLDQIVKKLARLNVKIFSTGGTKDFVESLGVPVTAVENITTYPSILGGRVKTLHPKVFGGILARRENQSDKEQLQQYEIPEIDLVIVDLYPFEQTVASGAGEQEIIEKIDIGGISLIRAAAKNFKDVLIVPSQEMYQELNTLLDEKNGETTIDDRKKFACAAFNVSSHYDTAIFNYFNNGNRDVFKQSILKSQTLRYGENPHQKGVFYGDLDALFDKLQGKEISYNNLLDIDAAVALISDFQETTFAILKHNNACGIASKPVLLDVWNAALAADPVSAFGGILITNVKVDKITSEEINKLFFEVIIAPEYDIEALEILKQKKNRIILVQKQAALPEFQFRTLLNGVIGQEKDLKTESRTDMKIVTSIAPTEKEYSDLEFANKVVKHTKSNTIVLAKNKQLLASGVGQTSRVDALRQAIEKAKNFGFNLDGAVMASDAFFPFPDCVEIANNAGIKAVIQPGGSIKDKDSIDYCNANRMAMAFTGNRHFKH